MSALVCAYVLFHLQDAEYVPALKGLGQALLSHAKEHWVIRLT